MAAGVVVEVCLVMSEVPWMAMAAEVLPMMLMWLPEAHCLCSMIFWAFSTQDFQAGHVLLAGARPSQSRQSLGKLPEERSGIVGMAASQALAMGRLAQAAFFGCP